jgi:putative MATE family efflux protein
MNESNKARLTEGPIAPTLVRLTIPMILGIVGMVAFNLIDTFFIGQLGTRQLAAISFTFPVVMTVSSIAMGLGVGTSALVSRAIGEGDQERVRRITTDSLVLAMLVFVFFLIAGLLTIDPVFRMLGATPDVLPYIREYMQIWYVSVAFVIIPMVGNNAIRATGDTRTPATIMLIAVLVNAVLDPLLIFGLGPFPRLGIAGAAVATTIARATIFCVAFWVLYHRERMITTVPPQTRDVLASWKEILYIGIPTTATNLAMPLMLGVLTSLVSGYGEAAVAAFGVGFRIDLFALTVVIALSSVLAPFVGQNQGARQHERMQCGVRYSLQFAVVWGMVMLLLLAVAGQPVARLFNDDPLVVAMLVLYLLIVPFGYGGHGAVYLANSVLNVLKKPLHAAALVMGQTFVLHIPLAYAGSALFGLPGIFGAAVVANIIAGVAGALLLRHVLHAERAEAAHTERLTPQVAAQE